VDASFVSCSARNQQKRRRRNWANMMAGDVWTMVKEADMEEEEDGEVAVEVAAVAPVGRPAIDIALTMNGVL
jgi:hypothetical protein